MEEKALRNAELEMRRGVLTLSVLSQLHTPTYGYALLERLSEKGMDIDQNTLYPLLRRLEKQGFLDSDWSVEGSRPRRYYVLNNEGKKALASMEKQWQKTVKVVQLLLHERTDGQK